MRIVSNVNNGRSCQTKTIIKEKSKVVPPQTKEFFYISQSPQNKFDSCPCFLERLYFLHCNLGYFHLSSIEIQWLRHLGFFGQCGCIQFPSQQELVNEMLLNLVTKTKDKYVSHLLFLVLHAQLFFCLQMSHTKYNTFTTIFDLINHTCTCKPTYVIVGIFEVENTIGRIVAFA